MALGRIYSMALLINTGAAIAKLPPTSFSWSSGLQQMPTMTSAMLLCLLVHTISSQLTCFHCPLFPLLPLSFPPCGSWAWRAGVCQAAQTRQQSNGAKVWRAKGGDMLLMRKRSTSFLKSPSLPPLPTDLNLHHLLPKVVNPFPWDCSPFTLCAYLRAKRPDMPPPIIQSPGGNLRAGKQGVAAKMPKCVGL